MFNGVINLFKYPFMLLMVLLSLDLFQVFLNLVMIMIEYFKEYQLFFAGGLVYIALWFVLLRNRTARLFRVFEHELTHTLFSLLSLNKIFEIRASMFSGHMSHFSEKGNWLIVLSPYFFSLLGVILIGVSHLASPSIYPVLMFFYGYVVVHHIHTVSSMTSFSQSDIQEVGTVYSMLVLPGANMLMLILLLTQIPHDRIHFSSIFDYLYNDVFLHYMKYLFAIIS